MSQKKKCNCKEVMKKKVDTVVGFTIFGGAVVLAVLIGVICICL